MQTPRFCATFFPRARVKNDQRGYGPTKTFVRSYFLVTLRRLRRRHRHAERREASTVRIIHNAVTGLRKNRARNSVYLEESYSVQKAESTEFFKCFVGPATGETTEDLDESLKNLAKICMAFWMAL